MYMLDMLFVFMVKVFVFLAIATMRAAQVIIHDLIRFAVFVYENLAAFCRYAARRRRLLRNQARCDSEWPGGMQANRAQAHVLTFEMKAQFRCAGSDEFLLWLDDLLEIKPSNLKLLGKENYDFRVYDSPREMMTEIRKYNRRNNKSRVVAGYCWEWVSQRDKTKKDIIFPNHKFAYQWNLKDDQTWSITKGSINQIGCIHTCQGLEFDYVGVIIGLDILYRDGKILFDPSKRAPDDFTIRGYKTMMKSDPEGTKELVRQIIKNTYHTLMSRGMKGCFVYVMDEELREYIKSRIRHE